MVARTVSRSAPRRSHEEMAARVDLAACYRLIAQFKMTDLVYTHISARIPGTEHFLLNPFGLLFEEVSASNLVRIDLDGEVVEDTPYHVNPDYEGIALDLDERERLSRDLGHRKAMILRNHGLLTAGESVAEAFSLMFYLERACEIQIATLSTGRELILPAPEVCEKVARQYENDEEPAGTREWRALLRQLDRTDPSYRD
jgi:ribulose-5-phosphate 4-epimerase/fuculose-1-phosphate aldolase